MVMKRAYYRVGFTAGQSAELWDRWKRGEGLKAIGRVLGKPSSCIFSHLSVSGGIRPPSRRRSRLALTLAEREEISRGLVASRSVRSMALALGRAPSTVSREIVRNGGSRWYRAAAADKRAWKQALRPKPCKLAEHGQLRQAVAAKLERNWSPEQIAGWLKRMHPGTEACQVSHETIYRSLYVQARGVLKKELMQHLRSRRSIRRSRHATQKGRQIERGFHPGKTRFHRGPCRTWSLGRRSALWIEEQQYRHSGRTAVTLCDARQGSQQGNPNRGQRLDQAGAQTPGRTLQISNLGPREGTRRSSALHHGNQNRRLFLRSAEPLAARFQ